MSVFFPSLTTGMAYLALSGVLLLAHIGLQAIFLTRQFGAEYNAGSRDEERPAAGLAGRAERALRNFIETFPLFAALVLAVQVAGKADWLSALGATLYFWARVAYLPLYLAGVPYVRSAVWSIAVLGIVLILWRLVF